MFSKSTQQLKQAGTSGEPQQNVKKHQGNLRRTYQWNVE